MNIIDKIFTQLDYLFDKIKKPFYFSMIIIIYGSYILILLGIYYINTSYIKKAFNYLEIFICVFLILRFNPLRKAVLHDFDQYLIFVSGLIILTNIGITDFWLKFIEKETPISSLVKKIHNH